MIHRQEQAQCSSERELRILFESDGMESYKAKIRARKIIEYRRKKFNN